METVTSDQSTSGKQLWDNSFEKQIQAGAYNTAPVEALVRNVAYALRERHPDGDLSKLRFLEMGCGTGPNLRWLAQKGIKVSGIDISNTALDVCRKGFSHTGLESRVDQLVEGSVAATPFAEASFDGIVEACVFQHLAREDRIAAFAEVARLLKPRGVFCGYMLDRQHTTFQRHHDQQLPDDPGTLDLQSDMGTRYHLENLGVTHFFIKEEYANLLPGFQIVDPCRVTYELPKEEAGRRGYEYYVQCMWAVYAVK